MYVAMLLTDWYVRSPSYLAAFPIPLITASFSLRPSSPEQERRQDRRQQLERWRRCVYWPLRDRNVDADREFVGVHVVVYLEFDCAGSDAGSVSIFPRRYTWGY